MAYSTTPSSVQLKLQRNPLLINTVLHTLFQFLDYKTLKECRLVCQQWKEINDWIFLDRSAFVLCNTTENIFKSFLDSPVPIPTLFKSINQENRPVGFSAFKFQLLQLKIEPMREIYLEPYKTSMTILEITYGEDISEYLSGLQNADHFLGPSLVKLKLHSECDRWRVSFKKLLSVRQLDLSKCKIRINPRQKIKIAPKELKLDCCVLRIKQENPDLNGNGSLITDFVDFRSLEKLELTDPKVHYNNGEKSYLILSISDCTNVKSLDLSGLVLNLDAQISPEVLILQGNDYKINEEWVSSFLLTDYLNSNAHLKKLKFNDGQTFDFQKDMSIDELQIEGLVHRVNNRGATVVTNIRKMSLTFLFDSIVDLAFLPIPKTIEVLELIIDGHIICSVPIIFPNLKQLFLRRDCANSVQYFLNCPKLMLITLDNSGCKKLDPFDVDLLPPNIKLLSFKGTFEAKVLFTATQDNIIKI